MKIAFFVVLIMSQFHLFAQEKQIPYAKYYDVPVDTLIYYESLSFDKSIFINAIRKWQTHSYSNEDLNCQFYPSCSNYFTLSVFKNNTYWGIVKGIDRIVRCNNSAKKYFKNTTYDDNYWDDGRMIDQISPNLNPSPSKNVLLATGLSVIPGLGRTYLGRFSDGIISFFSFGLLSYITYKQYKKENDLLLYLSGSFTFTFWLSDFYGAYRTAKTTK